MFERIKTLQDVVDWGLCIGCGACFYACPEGAVSLVNIETIGIRPSFDSARCAACTECLSICPGYTVNSSVTDNRLVNATASREFGAALEIWEGYAADPEIRHRASSGGILSALALYCLEEEGMAFVLHSAMDEQRPWMNRTVQSRSRAEILSRTGSRYAPASPCDGLGAIEESERPCVFIGKPCDAAAVVSLCRQRPELDRKVGLVLTFFCAGTPSTKGTLDLIQSMDVPLEQVKHVRYRGDGWPGRFTVRLDDPSQETSLPYDASWARLTRYRPLRCHLCPDGLGRVADIACGDAWDKFDGGSDAGLSIVLVRTPRGKEIVRRAMAAGYVKLTRGNESDVLAAQADLLARRREIFGRLFAMKLLLVPTPRFYGFSLFAGWIRLPLMTKMRTVLGTVRRLAQRGLFRRRRLSSSPNGTWPVRFGRTVAVRSQTLPEGQ